MPRALSAAALGLLFAASSLAMTGTAAVAAPHRPIVIVWLENHSAKQITRKAAPYLSALRRRGRSFANYHGIARPSLPNYLAFASGSTKGKRGSNSIKAGEIRGRTIWRQLSNAGISWGVYQESMPRQCFTGTFAPRSGPKGGPYVLRHNPATPFRDVANTRACRRVKPLSDMPMRLPEVSFVTPAICNGMHGVSDNSLGRSCRSGTRAIIRRGDAWMHRHVRAWRNRGASVFITFDEGSGNLYAVEVGKGIGHRVIRRRATHYSLLAGLERRFGLARLGAARGAHPLPLGR
jgi:hypothetical protein